MKPSIMINFHIHSTGSDGKLTPEKAVKEAIKAGIKYLCFTDHYKRANKDPWASGFFTKKYIQTIKNLQIKYQDKIDISFGAEIDWFEKSEKWITEEIAKHNFDYVLGSVHLLKSKKGDYFGVNFDEDRFQKEITEFGGIKNLLNEYFRKLKLMINSGIFDSVAHLDVIKTLNGKSKYFSQKSKQYKNQIFEVLEAIKKNKMCIEINTSGWGYSCKEQFPSLWILKKARKMNIPLTIGTDCHFSDRISYNLDKAYKVAKQAGYREIVRFKARKMIKIPI